MVPAWTGLLQSLPDNSVLTSFPKQVLNRTVTPVAFKGIKEKALVENCFGNMRKAAY